MSNVYSLTPRAGDRDERMAGFSSIDELLAELRAGRMVVVLDDEDRENEGDLIMAAEHATPEAVAFIVRHTSGIICVPMEAEHLARLDRKRVSGYCLTALRPWFSQGAQVCAPR